MGSTRIATVKLDILDWEMEYNTSGIRTKRVSEEKTCSRTAYTMWICYSPHKPWNLRIPGLFPQNPEELSGIANTADLLYTYSKGNLSSSQRTNGSGVSQTCNFKRRHRQPNNGIMHNIKYDAALMFSEAALLRAFGFTCPIQSFCTLQEHEISILELGILSPR